MNFRGLWQLSVCCRHNYSLLTRKGPAFNFSPESLPLKYELSKRSFIKEADSNRISPNVIKQALADSNMHTEEGHTSIITQCPNVGRTAQNSRSDRLNIHNTSGHFRCDHCSKQGTWPDLLDNLKSLKTQKDELGFTCFKDLGSVRALVQDVLSGKELLSSCVPFGSLQEKDADTLKATFGLQLLKTETLDRFGVRCDLQNYCVVFPVIVNGCVQSVKKISCHLQSNGEIGTLRQEYIPRSGVAGVFGLDMVPPSVTEIVLTTSEADAMAVTQESTRAAIALSRGYTSLPQEVLPSLERFDKIILWFCDNFEAWESAKMFSEKLNSKRCHIIRPSIDSPNPMRALKQRLQFSTILSSAKPLSDDSEDCIFTIQEAIYFNSKQDAGVKWTRFPFLNKLLKGHRRSELTVFTGPTGSGKTTFISEYSLDLCMQGVKTLWASFENNNDRLYEVMLTQFAQQNLVKNSEKYCVVADQFQALPMYFMSFHEQKSIKKVMDALEHAVDVHDIAHVVLDSLQFMMVDGVTRWNDCLVNEDSLILACRRFATVMNCHVTLVIHPYKEEEGDMFRSARTTQDADSVLILQDKRSVSGRKYLELQVTKNRFDGDQGLALLKFDQESLGFAAKEK